MTYIVVDKQVNLMANTGVSREDHRNFHAQFVDLAEDDDTFDHPHTTVFVPVFKELNNAKESDIVALLFAILPFDIYLGDLLPDDVKGLQVVLKNSCEQVFSYLV